MPSKANSLSRNAVMLYALTASNYLFGFLTIPYLTRVLGAETYGQIGFATAFSIYIQLVLDFGFMLSATRRITLCRDNPKKISKIMTTVCLSKVFLAALCFIVIVALCAAVPIFNADPTLFLLYFGYICANAMLPDFVYRGLEKMTAITIRTVAIKAAFLICIVLFIKSPEQYHLVPAFYGLGSFVALIAVFFHIRSSMGIWFTTVSISSVIFELKDSFQFFISRIASTFYSALNMMILGSILNGTAALGMYSACNNTINAGKSLSSPIADAMYPYMVRTNNYKLLVKVAIAGTIVLSAVCLPVGIFACDVCSLLFGGDYYSAGYTLRYMLPIIPLTLLSYLFGFPALTPLKREKIANITVVIGAIEQVIIIALLYFFGSLGIIEICIATLITETTVALIRICAFAKGLAESRHLSQSCQN